MSYADVEQPPSYRPPYYFRAQLLGVALLGVYIAYGWEWFEALLAIGVIYLPFVLFSWLYSVRHNCYRHLAALLVILAMGVWLFGYPWTGQYVQDKHERAGLSLMLFYSPIYLIPTYLLCFWLAGNRFRPEQVN